jgi:hypothetical protein
VIPYFTYIWSQASQLSDIFYAWTHHCYPQHLILSLLERSPWILFPFYFISTLFMVKEGMLEELPTYLFIGEEMVPQPLLVI